MFEHDFKFSSLNDGYGNTYTRISNLNKNTNYDELCKKLHQTYHTCLSVSKSERYIILFEELDHVLSKWEDFFEQNKQLFIF